MLAYYIEWHMRQALALMLFEDHERGGQGTERTSVVSPANRSNAARKKASRKPLFLPLYSSGHFNYSV
jgi:hypothetical protein